MLAKRFENSIGLARVKSGMRPAVVGLIAAAALTVARVALVDLKSIMIAAVAALLLFKVKLDPIVVLAVSGLLGAIIFS
jgi:chromate transporter